MSERTETITEVDGDLEVSHIRLLSPLGGDFPEHPEGLEFCTPRLAKFKQPRVIEFRDSLPRLPTGKLAKHALREEIRRRSASSGVTELIKEG